MHIYTSEYLANHMEGRGKIWATHSKEDANCFANVGFEREMLRQGADVPVEDKIFGALVEQLIIAFA